MSRLLSDLLPQNLSVPAGAETLNVRGLALDSRKVASILDTSSCVMQCLIPYGAQLLMASGLSKLSPAQIIPYLYYPFALAVCVLFTIVFRLPRRYS